MRARVDTRAPALMSSSKDMAGPMDSTGAIEAFCQRADAPVSRRSTLSFEDIAVGDRVSLCFGASEDTRGPFSLKIRAPSGATLLDRLVRELPTGLPQSEPPVEFVVSARGEYLIEIRDVRGQNWGRATLRVA